MSAKCNLKHHCFNKIWPSQIPSFCTSNRLKCPLRRHRQLVVSVSPSQPGRLTTLRHHRLILHVIIPRYSTSPSQFKNALYQSLCRARFSYCASISTSTSQAGCSCLASASLTPIYVNMVVLRDRSSFLFNLSSYFITLPELYIALRCNVREGVRVASPSELLDCLAGTFDQTEGVRADANPSS